MNQKEMSCLQQEVVLKSFAAETLVERVCTQTLSTFFHSKKEKREHA